MFGIKGLYTNSKHHHGFNEGMFLRMRPVKLCKVLKELLVLMGWHSYVFVDFAILS